MIKKTVTWILVADGTQAVIYQNDGPGKGIHRATKTDFSFELPSKVDDIASDQEGRAANPGGKGHNALGPRTDPRRHLESEFLRSVAVVLEKAAQDKNFDRLILVAAPRALGELRNLLPPHAKSLVARELDKDLVHLSAQDLATHLLANEAIQ